MEENRARRVADALRDRGVDAHLETTGIDVYGVRVVLGDGREAIWGNEGTSSLAAEVLLDGDLVGFVPEIPGSAAFDEAQVVDAIARADYHEPVGREMPEAPPPAPPLMREGGLFRRFLGGFREDSELPMAGAGQLIVGPDDLEVRVQEDVVGPVDADVVDLVITAPD
jgi:hypothetical protein